MATFTQKHYEKLAAFYHYELGIAIAVQEDTPVTSIVQWNIANSRVNTIRGLIRLHANTLQNDNPKFNAGRFYTACGLTDEARYANVKVTCGCGKSFCCARHVGRTS